MKIEIRVSGRLFKDGTRSCFTEVPEGSTIEDALKTLADILPLETSKNSVYAPLITQNGRQTATNAQLSDGDLIRLLYMIKGG